MNAKSSKKKRDEVMRLFIACAKEDICHRALLYIRNFEKSWDTSHSGYHSYCLGKVYRVTGFHYRAKPYLERAIQLAGTPKNQCLVWNQLGYLNRKFGNLEDARKFFMLAASDERDLTHCYNMAAQCLKGLGRLDEAEATIMKALASQDGDCEKAYLNLAILQALREDESGARATLNKALELVPDYEPAKEFLADLDVSLPEIDRTDDNSLRRFEACIREGIYHQALLYAEDIDTHRDVSESWYRSIFLGNTFLITGLYSRALPHLERATQLAKEQGEIRTTWTHLGRLKLELGDPEGALQAFNVVIEKEPLRNTPCYIYAAVCLRALDRLEEAEAMLTNALACEEGDFDEAYLNIAFFQLLRGDEPGARESLNKALKLDPDYDSAKNFLAELDVNLDEVNGE